MWCNTILETFSITCSTQDVLEINYYTKKLKGRWNFSGDLWKWTQKQPPANKNNKILPTHTEPDLSL